MKILVIVCWVILGKLNETIPTAPIQVNRQFYYLVSLLKAGHGNKLLDRYRMRFGMGPFLWTVLASNLVMAVTNNEDPKGTLRDSNTFKDYGSNIQFQFLNFFSVFKAN